MVQEAAIPVCVWQCPTTRNLRFSGGISIHVGPFRMSHLQTLSAYSPSTASRVPTGWALVGRVDAGEPLRHIPIEGESVTIGRRPGLPITLASLRVSGRHAELLLAGGHLFIRDLGSTNGTFVNRQRLSRTHRVEDGDHIQIADIEFRVEYKPIASATPRIDPALKKTSQSMSSFEPDWIFSQFNELVSTRAVTPHFQSIVRMKDESIIGYEALARSAVSGLENPGTMFDAAHLVQREVELSLLCRERAIEVCDRISGSGHIFVNTHPRESLEEDVLPSLRNLRRQYPDVSIVLEIHEGSVNDPNRFREFTSGLRDLEVGLAYDDFGSGRSRLLELIKAPPDYLKFDRSLIQDIHLAPTHQHRMVSTLIEMARDFATTTLAEGIETAEEAAVCEELGFDLAQGYFYGRPADVDTIFHRQQGNASGSSIPAGCN